MNVALGYKKSSNLNSYLVNEVLDASQEQLLLKVYDFAIVNCQKQDLAKTNKAISVLIEALNFDDPEAKEISIGLYKLYQFAQEQMRQKNFNLVLKILKELRETWVTIFEKAKK